MGTVSASRDVLGFVPHHEIVSALARYGDRDWGETSEARGHGNDKALEHGGKLLARYIASGNLKFFITTEADRSSTKILLAEDFSDANPSLIKL